MKESEYGGGDTRKTDGIFPAPHVRKPHETMRLLAKTNPMDPESGNEIIGDLQ